MVVIRAPIPPKPAKPPIAAWLERLGLAEYLARFVENRIDMEVLPDLTDADLKEMGILLGDRRKLMRAITDLAATAHDPAPAPAPAERRQLTVMFCDLVGSTALAARLDLEDLRGVIGAYHRCCAAEVERHGGFIAKYMGDGVLVYFGYPQAHEHDAEHAIQAGLALVEAVPQLATAAGVPLQVRVSIATGLVVVGDLLGSGEAQERGVVGEAPNLAARLQRVAEPGQVIVADTTRRLVGNLFVLHDLGEHDLKGITGPARAWAASAANTGESRFEALQAGPPTALTGRRHEAAVLRDCWARARAGAGQAVLISGEAGIGKSRLAAALMDEIGGEPHRRLRYACSPQRTDSALHPVIDQVEGAAGLNRGDGLREKLDKLDGWAATAGIGPDDSALFAELLSLPNDGRHPPGNLAPAQQRQRTLQAILRHIEGLARQAPLLMLVEDAQWIDPTTREILDRLVTRIDALPILLVVTCRPEVGLPWARHAAVTALRLAPLAQDEVSAMVDGVLGGRHLPATLRQHVLERADGIPLFVEEMTRAMLDSPAPPAVPASLQALLLARLDRLGPIRDIAQIGAAIGRDFTLGLLALVADRPEAELAAGLDRLVAAGLLRRQGTGPQAHYQFHHALARDAAYGTMLREQRQALHARIGDILETHFAGIADAQPQMLARHYAEAGAVGKAAALWAKAGRRSLARSALVEAADQFTRALERIADMPGTPDLRAEEIRLQVELAHALIHTRGHAAPETRAALDRAQALIDRAAALDEAVDDPLVLFDVLHGFWAANRLAFDGEVVCELAQQVQALAARQRAPDPPVIAELLMGSSLVLVGRIAQGEQHLDQAVGGYDPGRHRALAPRFGQDIRVAALGWRGWCRWARGQPDAAAADAQAALAAARDGDHPATMIQALAHAALIFVHRGDHAAAIGLADALVALAGDQQARFWRGFGMVLQGQATSSVDMTETGIEVMRATGATAWAPWYLSALAGAQAAAGGLDAARRHVGDAMVATAFSREAWCEADIHRIAGDVARAAGDDVTAAVHYQRSLLVARRQQTRSYELRAATGLALAWRDRGRDGEARALLAPIHAGFGEGFDTADLRRAAALLAELPG